MKMHRARDIQPVVLPYGAAVCIQLGFARFSATPDEADDLAEKLVAVAAQLRSEAADR